MSKIDEDRLKDLVYFLKQKDGISIGEIQSTFGVARRTAYRWLAELESRAFRIVKEGSRPPYYKILT